MHWLTLSPSPRDGTGKIDASEFRNVMGNLGERFTIPEGLLVGCFIVYIASPHYASSSSSSSMWAVEELMRIPEIDLDGKCNSRGTHGHA